MKLKSYSSNLIGFYGAAVNIYETLCILLTTFDEPDLGPPIIIGRSLEKNTTQEKG